MPSFHSFLTLAATTLGAGGFLWIADWLLLRRYPDLKAEKKFSRQLVMLGLTILAVVAVTLALPVDDGTRSQIISFVGLVVSGIFAFSSSTIFANLMAGIMIRIMHPYRAGHFITVGEYFGRVSEVGLLDTEIQNENRDLIAIPNLYLIARPISVVRSSGTIVSVHISLGYDVHHAQVETLLQTAIEDCGLEEPFVHVIELGDFSVTYKASGLLTDTKHLLTQRSSLCKSILDTLHEHGVEIMSPNFMNQRLLDKTYRAIPAAKWSHAEREKTAEQIVFDKAEEAEMRDAEKARLKQEIQSCQNSLEQNPAEEREALQERIEQAKKNLSRLENLPNELEETARESSESEPTNTPPPSTSA